MRGEWIEISTVRMAVRTGVCLSPCGESGLKFQNVMPLSKILCLSPCGESGLKFRPRVGVDIGAGSLPMRGEWIEIQRGWALYAGEEVSPHAGRVD